MGLRGAGHVAKWDFEAQKLGTPISRHGAATVGSAVAHRCATRRAEPRGAQGSCIEDSGPRRGAEESFGNACRRQRHRGIDQALTMLPGQQLLHKLLSQPLLLPSLMAPSSAPLPLSSQPFSSCYLQMCGQCVRCAREQLLSRLDPGSSPGRVDPLRGLLPLLDDRRHHAGAYRPRHRARMKPWLLRCFHSPAACLLLLLCMLLTACAIVLVCSMLHCVRRSSNRVS